MNDTLKKLANIIDLRSNGVITEMVLLLELHDMWRDLSNAVPAEFGSDYSSTFDIVDFAYIHFKQCCETVLEEATK
jgi:hypothetical protein